MCDTEHMFECPGSNDIDDDEESMDIFDNFRYNRMLEPSNKVNLFSDDAFKQQWIQLIIRNKELSLLFIR